MGDWRADAIKNGFVCKDCHEPIHPKKRKRWELHNHRCEDCDLEWENERLRKKAEDEYKPWCG